MDLRDKIVGVVGIGKMGTCIINALPEVKQLILIDELITEKIRDLANLKKGKVSTSINEIGDVDIVILVIPAKNSLKVAEEINNIGKELLLINVATYINSSEFEFPLNDKITTCCVKIIGEASEIEHGNKPILIIEKSKEKLGNQVNLINALFSNFGEIIYSESKFCTNINYIAAFETIKAILNVEKKLKEEKVPQAIIEKAIKNVMRGTCNTYPWDENDQFINKVKANL